MPPIKQGIGATAHAAWPEHLEMLGENANRWGFCQRTFAIGAGPMTWPQSENHKGNVRLASLSFGDAQGHLSTKLAGPNHNFVT
jgi:hypothetical protein